MVKSTGKRIAPYLRRGGELSPGRLYWNYNFNKAPSNEQRIAGSSSPPRRGNSV